MFGARNVEGGIVQERSEGIKGLLRMASKGGDS